MIPKRSHPLTNSHNGGRRFFNTSSNLENQYVGDSFVAGFPIYVFLSVRMHIFSIFAFQIICIREGFKKSKWKFKMAFAMKGGGHNGRTVAPEAILFESPC